MKRLLIIGLVGFSITSQAFAATSVFTTAIWIPYWRKTEGVSVALPNLDKVTQVSPFAYELQNDGSIKDALKAKEEPWTTLITEAKEKHVKVYPTILSYPQTATEQNNVFILIAQKKKRNQHIKDIVALVRNNKYDGIDIDYENKIADIRPYFSIFLRDLGLALRKNGKKLICTVEARTPPESKYATTSAEILSRIEYSNDYKMIGKYCDQVRVMAYDQGLDDQNLINQNTAQGAIYRPVADIEWVQKIMTLAMEDIPAKKLMLGVPTYGYKYEIIPATATSSVRYPRIGSMNFNYISELVNALHIQPSRNVAGELSFTYATTTGVNGELYNSMRQFLVWYSDADAIADKIRLAKLYHLGGVAIFKIDGGNDPRVWDIIK